MGKLILGDGMYFNKIKYFRENNELTQKEIAKMLKTSQSNYSRWENGKELIPLEKLNMFCNIFKTNMDYVLGITKNNAFNGIKSLNDLKIGFNLKKVRKDNNITQEQLSSFLNTSQSTICAYELGKTTLLTAFAIQIVYKYNISLEWLCGRKQNNKIDKKQNMVKI